LDYGAAGGEGFGYTGHGIGYARAGRDNGYPGPAGGSGPAGGGMGCHLLVAHIDYLDSLIQAGIIYGVQVAAAEGENVLHSLSLEGLDKKISATYCRHYLNLLAVLDFDSVTLRDVVIVTNTSRWRRR